MNPCMHQAQTRLRCLSTIAESSVPANFTQSNGCPCKAIPKIDCQCFDLLPSLPYVETESSRLQCSKIYNHQAVSSLYLSIPPSMEYSVLENSSYRLYQAIIVAGISISVVFIVNLCRTRCRFIRLKKQGLVRTILLHWHAQSCLLQD